MFFAFLTLKFAHCVRESFVHYHVRIVEQRGPAFEEINVGNNGSEIFPCDRSCDKFISERVNI